MECGRLKKPIKLIRIIKKYETMDRLDDLALFLRVLDAGSISGAARDMDISVAMASQRLARLEALLKVRLLHRTTRRLSATEEGLRVAEQARELLDQFGRLQSSVVSDADAVTGTLRMTISATFGAMYLAPLLPKFLERYPDVRVSVDMSDTMVDFVESGIELAVRIGALEDSSLIATELAPNHRVAVASPAYVRKHGAPKTPADLSKHECLLHSNTRGPSDRWTFQRRGGRPIAVNVSGRLESTQGEFLRDAALRGLGIATHSWWHVAEDIRKGKLIQVLPDYALPSSGIHAVIPQRKFVPPRVRAMMDYLRDSFAANPIFNSHP